MESSQQCDGLADDENEVDQYQSPDDYSDEERITEAPEHGIYIAGGVALSILGMFFGIPPFLIL